MTSTLATYAFGVLACVGLMVLWAAVQQAWSRAFPGPEPDALAARGGGCRDCRCQGGGACQRDDRTGAPVGTAETIREERS